MRNLRIAHVTATFPPYAAGTGNVCFHHARELVRRGHDVTVFTSLLPGAAPSEVLDGVAVKRLRPWLRCGNAALLPTLLRELRGFDLIHLHYPCVATAELVRLAALGYRTPLVISFHNDLLGDGARAHIFARYQQISARLTVRGAARLCVVSQDHYEASMLRHALPDQRPPVVALPNGVDVETFRPGAPDRNLRSRYRIPPMSKLVLFVAALDRAHHFKNLGTLLEAMPHVPRGIRLLIVGDGDLRHNYQREAMRLGVDDRTVFAGTVDHGALPAYFRSADVTILPSSPPESFGLVLAESLACGTPVVASDIPGVRTVVEHGRDGLLVEPRDPSALAGAIAGILADEGTRREMGRRGRAKIEQRYNWRVIGAHLEATYLQLLGRGEAGARSALRGAP